MSNTKSRFQQKLEKNRQKIKDLLGEEYCEVRLEEIQVHEEINTQQTSILATLYIDGDEYDIQGTGKGSVDALWSGIYNSIPEYELLEDVVFYGYNAKAVRVSDDLISTDSQVEVTISVMKGDKGLQICKKSYSVLKATILCFTDLFEYFINSQKAFYRLQDLRQHAENRHRPDLLTKYTNLLSDLTSAVPHSNLDVSDA